MLAPRYNINKNGYGFSYLVNHKEETLEPDFNITISNKEELITNESFFMELIKKHTVYNIYCFSYEIALIVKNFLDKSNKKTDITLLDDFENKDRSYINLDDYDGYNFIIPLSYSMWNVKFEDKLNVNCFTSIPDNKGYIYSSSDNGDTVLDKNTIHEAERIASLIYYSGDYTDIDKIILVSNYLQSQCQYISSREYYIKSEKSMYIADVNQYEIGVINGYINTILLKRYGICIGIANSTTLLLNNPYLNIDTRSVCGEDHAWNIIYLNGVGYFLDNTWNITMNPYTLDYAFKATRFSQEFILFSHETIDKYKTHYPEVFIKLRLAPHDFNREYIKANVDYLTSIDATSFLYPEEPSVPSYKI